MWADDAVAHRGPSKTKPNSLERELNTMIFAHLPAGYLVAKRLFPRLANRATAWKPFLFAAALGAIAPDVDLLYFHFIDVGHFNHHTYPTHFPIVWLGLMLGSALAGRVWRGRRIGPLALIISINGFSHLCLDSVAGQIWWLAPFVDQPFSLVGVLALHHSWVFNFFFHWTYGLELLIIAGAFWVAWGARRLPLGHGGLKPALIKIPGRRP